MKFRKDYNIEHSEIDYKEGGKVHFESSFDDLNDLKPTCENVAKSLYPNMQICKGLQQVKMIGEGEILSRCGEDFLITSTCFTASFENSISYIAFRFYTIQEVIQ